jgi:plasmid stabilization system protein ParE
MPRVIWTDEAEEQLHKVASDVVVEELSTLAAGLRKFPERGRRVPELSDKPEYDVVRELILPRKARLFYLFVPDSNEVIIVGLMTKGELFRREVLGSYFNLK